MLYFNQFMNVLPCESFPTTRILKTLRLWLRPPAMPMNHLNCYYWISARTLEGGLENHEKEHKLKENFFCKTPFQLGTGPKKVQKQGRDERT